MNAPSAQALPARDELLRVSDLGVRFTVGEGLFGGKLPLRALDAVSFELRAGETLGVVGESGCGKSTLVRALLGLVEPSHGDVQWCGQSLRTMTAAAMHNFRREVHVVFQDPRGSLDPRMTVAEIVAEPLTVHHPDLAPSERARRVTSVLERVGLSAGMLNRYPHEFSGGQCQRIGIARALVLEPRLLVCDEPVSALDVSVQAQIVNLLRRLQRELGLALLFVSHNLAVVRHLSARILVLYLGRMMELAPREALFTTPRHPYSQTLLAAIPDLPGERARTGMPRPATSSELPSALHPPSGCVFRTRCPFAIALCAEREPVIEQAPGGSEVACHRWREITGPAPG
jgi:oligopeptide transport system ATP-binding protein